MAIIGLIVLIISGFLATAAPLLSSYNPNQPVSGKQAQPEWIMSFPDGYYLSKNIVVVDDPLFKSPAAVQAWTLAAPPSTMSNLQLSYAKGVFNPSPPGSQGSLQLTYGGSGPGNATVYKTFDFPYHGPPRKFVASVNVMLSGASVAQPVHVRFFISRVGDQEFNLWSANLTDNGKWLSSNYSLDSDNGFFQQALNMSQGTASLTPAPIIFSSRQSYALGVEVSFYGSQRVNIDDMQLQLFGTAWGLLGTDHQGADLFTQNIYGSRISLLVGFSAAFIGIGLGLVVGLLAGFLGGIVDEGLMRFTDMMLVLPQLPLLLILVVVLGASIWNIIIVLGFLGWMGFARIIRSQVLTLKVRPFVEAARAVGSGPIRIITRHVFPNIVSLTYINLALAVPGAILSEAALEFLGLGDPSVTSWGHTLFNAEVTGALTANPPNWWWVLPPGIAIAVVSLAFVLVGYSLDELFNPKLRRRR